MLRRIVRFSSAVVAGALGIGLLTAGPAAAATVNPVGPVTFTNVGDVVLIDISTGEQITCDTSVLTGLTRNTPWPPVRVNSATFETAANPAPMCDGPGGTWWTMTATNLPWDFDALAYTASGGGVTHGRFNQVRFTLEGTDGCRFYLGGWTGGPAQIDAYYRNGTHVLEMGQTTDLRIIDANANCDPLWFNPGDEFQLDAAYSASPALTITLP